MNTFRRIRRRLTAWYVGVSASILLLFGFAVYFAITVQVASALNRRLVSDIDAFGTALSVRTGAGPDLAAALAAIDDAVGDLYLIDASGQAPGQPTPPPFISELATVALRDGEARGRPETDDEISWQVYGRAIMFDGQRHALVASARAIEIEDEFPGLIASFLTAALAALVLVGLGGAALARKSLVPVEQSVERMRRFVADASHELRTPTAALRTRAEVALQRPRGVDEYVATLEKLAAEADGLGRTVEGLLLLALADENRLPVHRSPVFLDDLLVEASEIIAPIAAAAGVELRLAEFEQAPVTADPGLIRQVLLILLENAVKHGGRSSTVHASVTADPRWCRVTIRDTGPGIPEAVLPHVFERFYRADSARTRGRSTGLGLSIARRIAEAHGARLTLESTPGEGTTAWFSLARSAPGKSQPR